MTDIPSVPGRAGAGRGGPGPDSGRRTAGRPREPAQTGRTISASRPIRSITRTRLGVAQQAIGVVAGIGRILDRIRDGGNGAGKPVSAATGAKSESELDDAMYTRAHRALIRY